MEILVESEQSYSFFRFSTKSVVLNSISEVSRRTLNKETRKKFLIGASK